MAEKVSGKRRRANTADEAVVALAPHAIPTTPKHNPQPAMAARSSVPAHDLQTAVNALDDKSVRSLLLGAAQANPSLALLIHEQYEAIIQKERSRIIDFDHYSKSLWYELNKKYSSLSGSKQYDQAFNVVASINGVLKSITNQCSENTNIATLKSAILTIRKIGKSICLAGDTLGHEVRNHTDSTFVDTMMHVAECFPEETRLGLLEIDCDGTTFEDKLMELEEMSNGLCIFEDVGIVRDFLAGEADDDNEVYDTPVGHSSANHEDTEKLDLDEE